MTFPTKADIEFFKEAKRIQGEWEPKAGDWVASKDGKAVFLVLGIKEGKKCKVARICASASQDIWDLQVSNFIWLPRQGQLQEMLEERGYEHGLMWELWGPRRFEPEKRYKAEVTSRLGKMKFFAPTPSIALGKCLLEVLKEE